MYVILGEDQSDANTLRVLVRRLLRDETVPVKPKGFNGCGDLLKNGAITLKGFAKLKYKRFIICHDADGPDPVPAQRRVNEQVVNPSGLGKQCCVVVPVQELEAWILADIEACSQIFPGWTPKPISNPESIPSPKELLVRMSRAPNRKPRYVHTTYNEIVARCLDLSKVSAKCVSFEPLVTFVTSP